MSTIRELLDDFICFKHSLGYLYGTAGLYLRKYVEFAEKNYPGNELSKEAINAYSDKLSNNPGSLYGSICAIREFGKYLVRRGIDVYVVPPKTVRLPNPEPPYFFTEDEIECFFEAADNITPVCRYIGRELILPALFRLLFCCGIRCCEARMLKCADISFDECRIDILDSKGGKSRRIYISDELCSYLHYYNELISVIYPGRIYFFPGYSSCKFLSEGSISANFRRIWKQAFPNTKKDEYPRAYDFRHHFAWENLNRWAAGGTDVNAMLPYLSRYMGHSCIRQTLYYFHFVPDFYPVYEEMVTDTDDIIPEVPS